MFIQNETGEIIYEIGLIFDSFNSPTMQCIKKMEGLLTAD